MGLISKLKYGESSANNYIFHGECNGILSQIGKEMEGKIDCIYIDPPYNTQEIYSYYNDSLDNDVWMDSLSTTVHLLFNTLSEKGSLWISINDKEVHYLKVTIDKILGRDKFVNTIIWEHKKSRDNRTIFSNNHEYILVYAKNPEIFKRTRNLITMDQIVLDRYKNPDNDPRGPWQSVTANVQSGHAVASQFYTIKAPNGALHNPPSGRCWVFNEEKMKNEIENNNIWFGKNGKGVPRIKRFLSDSKRGLTPNTLWRAEDVGTTESAKKHLKRILPSIEAFDTPKPEELIETIIKIASNEGDMVLDSFLGSGTTAVVAQKLNRRYIGIEKGNHLYDITLPRLNMTIDNLMSENLNSNLGYTLLEDI